MTPAPYESQPEDDDLPSIASVTGETSNESPLSEAWVTLRKRKWLILGMTLLGILYGIYKAKSQPRLFSSTGVIEIRSGSANEFKIGTTGTGTGGSSQIPTQVAILKSDSLILDVARALNLANNPNFGGGAPGATPRDIDKDPVIRQGIVGAVQGSLGVEPLPKTDLIRITCNTLDPQLSAQIVNQLVKEYRHYSLQTRQEATQRVTEFFGPQLDDLKKNVEASQGQMIDLQRQLGVLGFDPSLNQVTSNLSDLNKAVDTAELARIAAETRYRQVAGLDRSGGQGADSAQTSPSVISLRTQLDTARATMAQLSANLGPNHPQVLAVRDQIAELTKEIREEQNRAVADAKEAYNTARAQEDQTRAALANQQSEAFKLRDALVNYTLKQREFDANRLLYEGLREKLRTAGVQAGLESTEIDIVDPAVPPIAPSLKPASTIVLLNMLAMLALGVILAFVLDSLDTGLRTVGEVESVSGLPSLALIPRTRPNTLLGAGASTALRNLVVLSSPRSQSAEAFRALRTSLLLSVAGGEPQIILLTSATPSEGKTTVSMNLACVLAQRDVRVLLIDADLRRPTVHHRFGLNGKFGLTSILTGNMTLEQTVQTVSEMPNLDILVSGPVPPFPTEMLSSDSMRQLLDHARGTYTHIVMDSPPLLSVTDSIVLARDADAVVLIVRQGKSSKHALRRARDLLVRSGARITGIALNAVDLNSPEYYAYYGSYGYSSYGSEGVDSAGWERKSGHKHDGGKS